MRRAAGRITTPAVASSRAPTDPGVRGGDPGAGGALPGLNDVERQYFDVAKDVFQEVDAGPDGLGPRFNLDSCSGCHSQPTIGGTSPATNPQVAVATLMGAKNVVPSFITANGPIREARFVRNRDGSPDGGVHGLFVITGRSDAPGCNIAQPNFAAELARNNVVFRIPTPVFGLGLVENISDGALEASLAANAQQKRALGISGRFNRNGNDGTIARFGWKAQNKSLLLFSGEAYNVEMGITNELFQNERNSDPACQFKVTPNDSTPLVSENTASPSASFQNDIDLFAAFMRFSAPPTPASAAATPGRSGNRRVERNRGSDDGNRDRSIDVESGVWATSTVFLQPDTDVGGVGHGGRFERDGHGCGGVATAQPSSSASSGASVTRGNQVFSNVGCQACHTKTFTTEKSPLTGQSNVTIQPLSDFALHEMERDWRTAFRKGQPMATNSERLRCGESANASFSFTMAGPRICTKQSSSTPAVARKPMPSSTTTTCCRERAGAHKLSALALRVVVRRCVSGCIWA